MQWIAENDCFVQILLQNGFDPYRSDTLLMAHKYGVLKFVQCLGYGADKGLMKGHTIVEGYYVDGQVNVTHMIGIDAVLGSKFYGPKNSRSFARSSKHFQHDDL
jgi:hypothetical protein